MRSSQARAFCSQICWVVCTRRVRSLERGSVSICASLSLGRLAFGAASHTKAVGDNQLRCVRSNESAFSRGLAENDMRDRHGGQHTSRYQNRSGKAVGLETGVGPLCARNGETSAQIPTGTPYL